MTRKNKINLLKQEVFKMFPDAKAELDFENDFQLLIAVLMSAQTTDKQVNRVNKNFFQYLKTPED
jgi:endonuclease-3